MKLGQLKEMIAKLEENPMVNDSTKLLTTCEIPTDDGVEFGLCQRFKLRFMDLDFIDGGSNLPGYDETKGGIEYKDVVVMHLDCDSVY